MGLYECETFGPHSKTLSQKKRKWRGGGSLRFPMDSGRERNGKCRTWEPSLHLTPVKCSQKLLEDSSWLRIGTDGQSGNV